jgi:formyltetrahydrofolate-dependent phosphoribosylglycinamide formyltransferase
VAVLVSGGGTNLQALLDGLQPSVARVTQVIASRADAGALDRARRAKVPITVLVNPGDPTELTRALADADLVVLAGYLKLVPPAVVSRFPFRMINIHPALLPDFGGPGMYGARVHTAVIASGARESGATVHYVSDEYDRGAIIAQGRVSVLPGDTPQTLAARVLAVEHRLLPRVVMELVNRALPQHAVRLEDSSVEEG